jgi:hypothetical protein
MATLSLILADVSSHHNLDQCFGSFSILCSRQAGHAKRLGHGAQRGADESWNFCELGIMGYSSHADADVDSVVVRKPFRTHQTNCARGWNNNVGRFLRPVLAWNDQHQSVFHQARTRCVAVGMV